MGQAPRQGMQPGALRSRQMMLHKQIAMREQVRDLLLQPYTLPRLPSRDRVFRRRSAPFELGLFSGQVLAHLGHSVEHGQSDLFEDMEFTDLMGYVAKDGGNRYRVQIRTIGRDSGQPQAARLERGLEAAEKSRHELLGGGLAPRQDLVEHAFKGVVVHDGQYAERPIVDFVRGNVAGEIRQGPVQIILLNVAGGPFFPRLRPNSGWSPMVQTPESRAITANWRGHRANRLQPRCGRLS